MPAHALHVIVCVRMPAGGPSRSDGSGASDGDFEGDTVLSSGDTSFDDAPATEHMAMPLEMPTPAPVAPVSAPPAKRSNVPKRLAMTDVVPEFRAELKLTRNATGGYEVRDTGTGQTFSLNEYEGSLARMLNGRRPVSEILVAGSRLGMPINLESLQKFIDRLDERGFLGPVPAAATSGKTWPSRGAWEASVRTLFQSGIRLLRMGKHVEAAGYFEALLEEDPDNIEARELLEMAKAAPPVAAVEAVSLVPIAPPQDPRASQPMMVDPRASQPFVMPTAAPQVHELYPQYQQQPFYPEAPPLPPTRLARRSNRTATIAVIALIVSALGVLIVLSVGSNSTSSEPAKTGVAPVVAPPDAIIAMVAPVDAAVATPDAAVAIAAPPFDAAVAIAAPPPDAAIAVAVAPADAGVPPPDAAPKKVIVPPRPPPPPVAQERVESPTDGEVTAFLRGPRHVQKGEKLFDVVRIVGDPAKIKAATTKVADMEKMAKEDPVYEAFLADARKELESVRNVTTNHVVAPHAGKATPRVKQGATVRAGQLLFVME